MPNPNTIVITMTSGSYNVPETGNDIQIVHNAGATLTLSVALPSTPVDGQIVGLTSVNGITTLTLSALAGILNLISSLAANTPVKYQYVASLAKWVRV